MPIGELERLWRPLEPLSVDYMPISEPLPRESRFRSPVKLSMVH
jgi:hypothetical protein